MYELKSARYIATKALLEIVQAGDTVIDATMGNGYDTLLLAKLVTDTGHVFAFDIQQRAILQTRERLESNHCNERCTLLLSSHETIKKHVHTPVSAVVFNLGWLPSGDKTVTTKTESTINAVSQGLALLKPNGIVTICAYPGHSEGDLELATLLGYCATLKPQEFTCLHHRFINAGKGAPECIIIQKC